MCSTAQSPRARKAFSSAWAARTCPAPDVADSNSTRGFDFIFREFLRMRAASGSFSLSGGDFFQNAASDFLQFAEARQVILKIVVQKLRVLRAQFRPQNHVTQFYGMRKQRVFLQFLERNLGIVVIHGFPRQKSVSTVLYRVPLREMSSRIAEEVALRGSCRNGHEFVARDFRGDSHPAIFGGLDAHNFAEAADIHIARLRHLLWKRDNEFNLVANFEFGVSKKVKAAVTEVPSVRVQFVSLGLSRQNPHGQAHCEPPRFAALFSISHRNPLGIVRLAQS